MKGLREEDGTRPPRQERPHRRLIVWSKSMDLVTRVYSVSGRFPPSERYGLTGQMRRAAVSVPSNIAEGAARKGQKDYVRFLYTARASLSELDTQLEIGARLAFVSAAEQAELQQGIDEVSRMLNSMIRSLTRGD
jgi:four helix bundle protein